MRGWRAVAAVFVTVFVLAACGDSDDDNNSSSGTTLPATEGSCPFSGSTDAQNQQGAGEATTLNKVTPSVDGCVDSVTFEFSPSLAGLEAKYEEPAEGAASSAVLVLTFSQTSLGDGLDTGTTQNPSDLNYVSEVTVTDSDGTVEIEVTLDKKRPFLLNSSEVPAEAELSIG
jgi:hypothetical protein